MKASAETWKQKLNGRKFHETLRRIQKQPPEVFYEKKVFLEISQNPQENTCTRVSFSIMLQGWGLQFSKNTFSYRTPPVAASIYLKLAYWHTGSARKQYFTGRHLQRHNKWNYQHTWNFLPWLERTEAKINGKVPRDR